MPTAVSALLRSLLASCSFHRVAPAAPEDTMARVRALLDAGQAEEALKVVEPLARGRNPQPEALLLRSSARILLGEVEPARKDLERALQLDPALRQGWLNLAGLEIAAKRYDAALTHLERASTRPAARYDLTSAPCCCRASCAASARFAAAAAQPASGGEHYLVATIRDAATARSRSRTEKRNRARRANAAAAAPTQLHAIENNAAFKRSAADYYAVPGTPARTASSTLS